MDAAKENLYSAKFILAEKMEFNADSVEWCPFQEFSQYMTCGTYQLDEDETPSDDIQTRNGSITLYSFTNAFDNANAKLEKIDIAQSGGVLDLKWCPQLINGEPVLGAACSNGKIILLRMSSNSSRIHLQELINLNLSLEEKKMILSLDWSCQEGSITTIASDTKGNLNYVALRESELSLLESWNAHGFESWIVAFDYSHPNVVYSGGDDCRLKGWDLRNVSSATFINKSHSMGVTAISKSKLNEHLLVTGSYDENVFLWDVRSMKIPISEISLNGGIWRLKWHPQNPSFLLSASMHNGFHVLSIEDGALKEKAHYNKHESLAYGVDWRLQSNETGETTASDTERCVSSLVASCSFYDKLLHIWEVNN
ncbi:diphthine methyltransferase-like [Argiope bruennichi]|uniref:diphthine methyltransferase-like n=1 Tax=Argiope bruennichi TaxID=94029 RepID=UPI002494CC20|nr:diphthine methyltransferase-like [Argiope bruennichi]